MRLRVAATVAVAAVLVALLPGTAQADEIRDGQWYLDALGIHDAHELSQGAGVTIGVIDTGVDPNHPDLEGQVISGTSLAENAPGDGLEDEYGHGTAVSSVLVGNDDANGVLGIAPKAKIISVNIFEPGAKTSDPHLMEPAIEWLVDQGVDVISTSAGGSGGSAIQYATDHGVPVVGAAGNRFQDWGLGEHEVSGTNDPGGQSGAIPVSGTTIDGEFWDRGLDLSGAAPQPRYGLSAPAVDIPIALPGGEYDVVNGTSFSAPIVAGTLALIRSAYPDLDYTTWIARLLETVDDKGPEGYDVEYGWGIVNPLAALTEDVAYEDEYTSINSPSADRLPLDQQGDDISPPGNPDGDATPTPPSDSSDAALDGDTGMSVLWLPITLAAAIILAGTIAITVVVHRGRRRTALDSSEFQAPVPPR
ncbi:subtilase family protein [Stackebrandtia albiflava]|uniref:Subtilase family protein n=1 Tax=Stackebrandtia albiflava TaxID=406432 RepID=A0A562UYI4_9ACTN|nr:S8 family serine peptidase [Stackebrandtia albiflava]TWJ10679.1 subtilase family protein [Stackebrandtia albiflava]